MLLRVGGVRLKRVGGRRLQVTVQLSEKKGICSNSSKCVIYRKIIYFWLSLQCCVHIYYCICMYASVFSVVLLCLKHMKVSLSCVELLQECVHLVEYFIGLCNVRLCALLAVADTLRYQQIRWGVCCPCGN